MLENDVKKLKHDLSIYHSHILKTEVWCENMGKWTTRVASARLCAPNDPFLTETNINSASGSGGNSSSNENLLLFEIHVQLHEENKADTNSLDETLSANKNQFKDGWIIYRSLKQFESLHEKLIELIPPNIKNQFKKIPNVKRNMLSKNFDEDKIKQATLILNEYLKVNRIKKKKAIFVLQLIDLCFKVVLRRWIIVSIGSFLHVSVSKSRLF